MPITLNCSKGHGPKALSKSGLRYCKECVRGYEEARRNKRPRGRKPARTIPAYKTSKAELERLKLSNAYEYPTDVWRPRTRGECADGARPCPWVSCRYHLYLDVNSVGSISINFPGLEPDELKHSCALDLADREGMLLDDISHAMNVTRERVRQIEAMALPKLVHLPILRELAA